MGFTVTESLRVQKRRAFDQETDRRFTVTESLRVQKRILTTGD